MLHTMKMLVLCFTLTACIVSPLLAEGDITPYYPKDDKNPLYALPSAPNVNSKKSYYPDPLYSSNYGNYINPRLELALGIRKKKPYTTDPYPDPYKVDPYSKTPLPKDLYSQGPYGQNVYADPYGRDPYSKKPLPKDPYSQVPYGQNAYADPYRRDPYSKKPLPKDPYSQVPYGQNVYADPYKNDPYPKGLHPKDPYSSVPFGKDPYKNTFYPVYPSPNVPYSKKVQPISPLFIKPSTNILLPKLGGGGRQYCHPNYSKTCYERLKKCVCKICEKQRGCRFYCC